MEPAKLEVTRRQSSGKQAARSLRRSGEIPAVAYGKGSEATALQVSPKELRRLLAGEYGRNLVFDLNIDGKEQVLALLADYQVHPVSRDLLHADFLRIDAQQEVCLDVPLKLTGKCKGVVMGGNLHQVFRKLPVKCLPANIPVKLTHDVTELGIDEYVHVEDLTLPEGVRVDLAGRRTVAAVFVDKRAAAAAEEEAAAAEAAPAAEAPKK